MGTFGTRAKLPEYVIEVAFSIEMVLPAPRKARAESVSPRKARAKSVSPGLKGKLVAFEPADRITLRKRKSKANCCLSVVLALLGFARPCPPLG